MLQLLTEKNWESKDLKNWWMLSWKMQICSRYEKLPPQIDNQKTLFYRFLNLEKALRFWFETKAHAVANKRRVRFAFERKAFDFWYSIVRTSQIQSSLSIHADKPRMLWLLSGETVQAFVPSEYIYTYTNARMHMCIKIKHSHMNIYTHTHYVCVDFSRMKERSWKERIVIQSEASRKICIPKSENLILSGLLGC